VSASPSPSGSPEKPVFTLRRGDAQVEIDDTGFRTVERRMLGRSHTRRISYEDVTHVAVGERGLWLGLRRSVLHLRSNRFREAGDSERLAREILARIASGPRGAEQLARMAEVDRIARQPAPRVATTAMVLLCIAIFVWEWMDPFVQEVGAFIPALVRHGEFWRIFTANFLHGLLLFPIHIGTNLIGIFGLSFLVERPLGPLRCFLVMGFSALGAMAGSAVAGYSQVLGASGVLAGLAGAALCLELHHSDRLPAWWRLPRRLFIAVLVAEGIYGVVVPVVAGGAHVGGFVAGYFAARIVTGPALERSPAAPWERIAAFGFAIAILASLAAPVPLLLRQGGAFERHGRVLLSIEDLPAGPLNDTAWRIATEVEATPDTLDVALALAERAVERSERRNPDILDTLAEVQFQSGRLDHAVEVIDEAIAIEPSELYFREQRRRFTGERDPDDRPAPPVFPWIFRAPPPPPPPPEIEI
jgi:membrane associated rhomboid family serine protease